jgi:hypothetical protein
MNYLKGLIERFGRALHITSQEPAATSGSSDPSGPVEGPARDPR